MWLRSQPASDDGPLMRRASLEAHRRREPPTWPDNSPNFSLAIMNPVLLLLIPLVPRALDRLRGHFELILAPTQAERDAAIASHGAEIDLVLTNGSVGLTADEVDAMPRLRFASVLGVGYENVAIDHCRRRGIMLANGAGTNDDCVADHALALLLAVVRAVPAFDAATRRGVWRDALPMRPHLAGRRLGILGLGAIGRKIAGRAAGFGLEIAYHSRTPKFDVPYRHFTSLHELAEWCDLLVVATPGGADTRHLVDAKVLAALGSDGFLVNIARGSVVDIAALADALANRRLAGAALDVYEGEPKPPAALLGLENVVLTPHVAGSSPGALAASLQCFLDNAALHLAGQPVRTPI